MKRFFLLCLFLLGALTCLAQQQEAPAPPVTGQEVTTNTTTPRYEDDFRPLSGVQNFDVGTRVDRQNLLIPTFSFSQTYGTNPGVTSGTADNTVWGSTSNVGASVQLLKGSVKNLFSLTYNGNAQFNYYDTDLNNNNHNLNLSETWSAGRWTFVAGDSVTYQANAYGAFAPLVFPGSNPTGGSGFTPGTSPNDSVLTQQNTQINNTVLGQTSYGLSRSSSLTANVSYGLLHYLEGDLLDTRQLSTTGGFDHKFGHNTIGLAYTYTNFMYDQPDQSFQTNQVLLTYGRRIVGRFSFDVAGGPTFTSNQSGQIASNDVVGSGQVNLRYVGARSSIAVGYMRGITGGSGVTTGALTDSVYASGSRNITRNLSSNFSVAYNRNSTSGIDSTFDTIVVGAGVSRAITRNFSLSIGYTGQWQTSNTGVSNLSSQAAVFGIHWNIRPVRLR